MSNHVHIAASGLEPVESQPVKSHEKDDVKDLGSEQSLHLLLEGAGLGFLSHFSSLAELSDEVRSEKSHVHNASEDNVARVLRAQDIGNVSRTFAPKMDLRNDFDIEKSKKKKKFRVNSESIYEYVNRRNEPERRPSRAI